MKRISIILSLFLALSFVYASEVTEADAAKCEIAYEQCQAVCDDTKEKDQEKEVCYLQCDKQFESCLKALEAKEK